MKKGFLAIALFLGISNPAMAQWSTPSGGSSLDDGGRRIREHIPDIQRELAPFIKDDEVLSQTWDPNIAAFGNNPDGMTVTCFAEDSDHLYVGGDFLKFDTIHTQFIVQYDRKSGLWSALDAGLDNGVTALATHNGKLYVAGYFGHAGSGNVVVNYIAMWDGTAWNNLGGGMNDAVRALAFVGDTLYAGGDFTQAGGNAAYYLATWDGHSWQEASGGTSYPVQALVASQDSLFVGGHFNFVGSQNPSEGINARGTAMLRDGVWTPLGVGFNCNSLALFHGKLWVGGDYYLNDGTLANGIASWDGSNWSTYGPNSSVGTNSSGDVAEIVPFGDSLFVLGNFSSIAGVPMNSVAVYYNGTWSPLAGGVYGFANAAIPFDGKLYVGGEFTKAGSTNAISIATLDGSGWKSVGGLRSSLYYNEVGWASAEVLAIATSQRYVAIGGEFIEIAHQPCGHVAVWDKQTNAWLTLGQGVDGQVRSLAFKGDTLIVGGGFNHAGSITSNHIAMCNMTTKLWSAMGAGAHRYVGAIAVHNDSIYAPIFFSANGGADAFDYLGRWDDTGWSYYGNGLQAGYVHALAWQGSTLYAGGEFYKTDDGTVVDGIAQLQEGIWGALNNGVNNYVYALAASGDSLYIGGNFTGADGQTDSSLGIWNGASWNPIGAAGFDGPVVALAADGNGGVYAGGNFSEVAQVGRGNLVHWNGSKFGTVASGVNNTVDALATDDVALYAGGWFQTAGSNQITSLHFGALDGAGAGVMPVTSSDASWSVYPNPSPASSTISLDLAKAGDVRIELFSAIGIRISLLANGFYPMGRQDFSLDAHALPSGIYFLRLMNNGVLTTKNFIVSRE